MEASVWRMGRTAEDRLVYGRFFKAATFGNGLNEREESLYYLGYAATFVG